MKGRIGRETKPPDVAGIRRYFGFDQDDVEASGRME
jgi:hypothetical protein